MNFRRIIKRGVIVSVVLLTIAIVSVVSFAIYKLRTTRSGVYRADNTKNGEVLKTEAGPAQVDMIVYTSLRPSTWDIFLFDKMGGEPRQLTDDPSLDYNARFSPDGRWIVFTSERTGNADLFALDLEKGGPPVQLTRFPGMDDAAAISPDGKQIAFVSTRSGNPDIYVMAFEPGSFEPEVLAANLTRHPYGDFNPAWSPDGKAIAFASNRQSFEGRHPIRLVDGGGFRSCIFTINADGSGLQEIASALLSTCGDPIWSEDGRRIIYYEANSSLNSRIFEMDASGSKRRAISPPDQRAITPCRGPDGGVIFVTVVGEGGLARMRATTSLSWMAADGASARKIGDLGKSFLSPDYHAASGRIVCHGNGTTRLPLMQNDRPFTWPSPDRLVQLPDRVVRLKAYRGYFPTFPETRGRIFDIPWIHESDGKPPGPAPIISADYEGNEISTVYSPDDDRFVWAPVITADGEWIFFSKGPRLAPPDTNVDVWKVRKDGSGAVNLTPDSSANDALCDVSADGRRVVFRSGRGGDHDVYLMDENGRNVRRLSASKGPDTMPSISPDGKTVVYVTARAGHGLKLWIQPLEEVTAEGRLLEPARANLDGMDMHPRFSPDGMWVVFTSDRGGLSDEWMMCGFSPQPYGELYAAPVDASQSAVRLTNDKWEDGLAFWGRTPR